jgi:hypothetical protein
VRGVFILGEEVRSFEAEWAEACRGRGAVGIGNGTDALTLALIAAGIKPGDEVVTTPLTAAYTALAIVNAGAKTVFADIDEKTFNLNAERIERPVTSRTRAIVPVHLYGQCADLTELGEIAARYKLMVSRTPRRRTARVMRESRLAFRASLRLIVFTRRKTWAPSATAAQSFQTMRISSKRRASSGRTDIFRRWNWVWRAAIRGSMKCRRQFCASN